MFSPSPSARALPHKSLTRLRRVFQLAPSSRRVIHTIYIFLFHLPVRHLVSQRRCSIQIAQLHETAPMPRAAWYDSAFFDGNSHKLNVGIFHAARQQYMLSLRELQKAINAYSSQKALAVSRCQPLTSHSACHSTNLTFNFTLNSNSAPRLPLAQENNASHNSHHSIPPMSTSFLFPRPTTPAKPHVCPYAATRSPHPNIPQRFAQSYTSWQTSAMM